jgi:L-aspartate oxidase
MDDPRDEPRSPIEGTAPTSGLELSEVRAISDRLLSVQRSAVGLTEAVKRLGDGGSSEGVSATSIAWLLASAALRRQESRGGHFRDDFPVPREAWRHRQAVDMNGWADIPVPDERIAPQAT